MNVLVNDTTPEFVTWLAACIKMCDDYMTEHFPNLSKEVLVAHFGTRYVRIDKISKEIDSTTGRPVRCFAWAFIDRTCGDVLKPATYKAPAKHARGNLFDTSGGMASMSNYGPAYLRG
jgi:hypothetical protein